MSDQKDQIKENNQESYRSMLSNEELKLIERSAKGDEEAFSEFYRLRCGRVRLLAAKIAGYDEADDITQQTFIKLWRKLPKISDLSKTGAWLARTASNASIDLIRKNIRKRNQIEILSKRELKQKYSEHFEKGDLLTLFDHISGKLGNRQRLAFVMMIMEGYSSQECAEIMEISDSTVRNLVRQARQTLRSEIRLAFPEYNLAVDNEEGI